MPTKPIRFSAVAPGAAWAASDPYCGSVIQHPTSRLIYPAGVDIDFLSP